MVIRQRKITCAWLLLLLPLILSGCGVKPAATAELSPTVQNEPFWIMSLDQWEFSGELNASRTVIQYNGEAADIQYHQQPTQGKVFLLVKLSIEKKQPGPSTFHWSGLEITDGKGFRVTRMENDTFLENYNLPRLKSTDLVIGVNEGWCCFEVPLDLEKSPLTLVYKSSEGLISIPLE